MPDWKRTTKEVLPQSLPPEMVAAIHGHIEQHNLGPILSETLMCVQTDSEKRKKGLFGGAEVVQVGAILTPRWLVWITQGIKKPAAVLSAQLANITVQDYAQTPFARMIPDSGIEVSGLFTDSNENASAFIGLDEGGAANKFRDLLLKAAQDAKK